MAIADRTLLKLQAASGMVLALFLTGHLAGHLLANIGLDEANAFLHAFRAYVRVAWVELGVLPAALLVHAAVGAVRFMRPSPTAAAAGATKTAKPAAPSPTPSWAHPWSSPAAVGKWHRWTGLFLSVSLFGHVFATRIAPALFIADSDSVIDYNIVTFTLKFKPYLFHPYYVVFAGAGAYHLIHGVGMAINLFWPGASAAARATGGRSWFWRLLSLGIILAMASAIQGFAGRYYPVNVSNAALIAQLQYNYTGGFFDLRDQVAAA